MLPAAMVAAMRRMSGQLRSIVAWLILPPIKALKCAGAPMD